MHQLDESPPPCTLLFRYARVLMAPSRPLGRLVGPKLTQVSLTSGLLLGVYAYLAVTRRIVLRHGSPTFPAVLPFALKLPAARLLCDSGGAPVPVGWELERLLYRNAGATTAEATAATLAALTGYHISSDGAAHWHTRSIDVLARICLQPQHQLAAPTQALTRLEQQVLLPFIAESPARAHDLASECRQIVGWLHAAQEIVPVSHS